MTGDDPRQRLLDSAVDHVSDHGIGDLSLRSLAAALGTSHRMLIHHFGSKEGLWVAIVGEVERRQLETLAATAPDESATLGEALWRWWVHISAPEHGPSERLFFEIYGRALHRNSAAAELLEGSVESWLTPAAEQAEMLGLDPTKARAFARLGVAVSRGLLLDLLATEDRAGVDEAMRYWIELNEAALDSSR